MMMSSTSWPTWSIDRNPADLARYVVPDEVARLVPKLGRSGEAALVRLNTAWEALRSLGVGYVREPEGRGAEGQLIRTPGEVLETPRNATCLDMALVLAGACAHVGLASAVLVVDPKRAGGPRHTLLAVLLGPVWPAQWQDVAERPEALGGLADQVRADVRLPGGDVVVLDPVGITHSLGMTTIEGTDQSLELAAAGGHGYLTSGQWDWRLGVVAGERADAFAPAQVPEIMPLGDIYRQQATAESALRLLCAEHEVTPFEARDELTVLIDICEKAQAGHGTRVVIAHGAGGCGKTRLALELAKRQRQEGWYAGPLKEWLAEADPTSLPWLAKVTAPLLVVVDGADARVGETQALLRALQDRAGSPAVVVLTARSLDGDWLVKIQGDKSAMTNPVAFETLELPAIHPHPDEVFRGTFIAVRDAGPLSVPATEAPSLPAVASTARWTTLDLVLLGWLAAQGTTDLPTSPGDLYDAVLTHEMEYWARTFAKISGQTRPNQEVLAQAGAVLTLLQPTVAGADKALQALPGLSDDGKWRDNIVRTMTTCMEPHAGECLAIRPDQVGDHHLLQVLDDLPDLLHSCLPPGTNGESLLGPLLVLNRAGQADGTAAARHLGDLMRAQPASWPTVLAVASALGGPAQAALEELVAVEDCPLPLDKLSGELPLNGTRLRRLAMLVDDSRLRTADADPSDPSLRAALLLAVSGRHGDAGDLVGALSAIEMAVTSYRELAAGDPSAFTADLAMALNNLSVRRSEAGDAAGALAAIGEAVTSYRVLAAGDPVAFTHHLAMALNNLSIRRSEAGDPAGALTAVGEAAACYQELAAGDPSAFSADHAMALHNLSIRRSQAGDIPGALSAIEEAVTSYRELAAGDPALFTPDLAMALNNLSIKRSEAGDHAGALSAIEEAVTSYRELAAANPSAFTHYLSASLSTLSARRSAAGDSPAALRAMEEAVTSCRELAAANPAAFTHRLAMGLNNLSNQRSEAGDRAGAMSAVEEAVAWYRELVADNSAAFTPDFTASLVNLSKQRSEAGDRAGALSAIEEAVSSCRELTAGNPAAFTADLAMALNTLSERRSAIGDWDGALSALEDALTYYRELCASDPDGFTPDLAMALNNLSGRRSQAGDIPGALSAIEEAVSSYRELAAGDPAAFTHYLTASLNNLSNQRSAAGDPPGALSAIEEAVTSYRELAAGNPAAFTPDLAGSLNNLSNQRSAAGDPPGALNAVEEAVTSYRKLAAATPVAFALNLATSSKLLADGLAEAGHEERAGQVWDQSCAVIPVPLFRAYLTAADAQWHDRRGDRAHAEARLRQAVSETLDSAADEQPADRGAGIPDFAVGESRQYVRSVAMSMNPPPDGLPSWATVQIPDLDLDLARAWAGAASLSAAAQVLQEHAKVVTGPTLSESLNILVTLHPGDQRLTWLCTVHDDIVEHGLSQVLAKLTTQVELQALIKAWIDLDTWAASFSYLRENSDRLRTEEVFQLLAAQQDPATLQHAAILTLCETVSLEEIEELATNASTAADLALDAVEAADLGRVRVLTLLNPHALQLPGTGLLLQAVLLLAAGQQDQAAEAVKGAAVTATDVQRRAHTTALRRLATHAERMTGVIPGVAALIDAYTASIASRAASATPVRDSKGTPSS